MADNPQAGGLPQKAAALLGLPEGLKFYSPYPFSGMNQQDSPTTIDDKEFVYLENFVKLGNGQFRTLWDVGASVYTAPGGKTIVYYKFFTLASTDYCAIFLSDGSAIQLDVNSLVQTAIGASGFYSASSGFLPYARQWGSTYLLISNRNTPNDYWVWDGALLYEAGSSAPNGVNLLSVGFNYNSPPAATAVGGAGSGMAFSVQVSDGSLSEVQITDPGSGYQPGDVVQVVFSGGGSDTPALLQAVLSAGGVGGVAVSAGGSGYTSAPSVTFPTASSVGVASVTVTAGGSYTQTPTVVFSGGGGTGAAGVAIMAGWWEHVAAVVITSAGSGYTSAPTISFVGGTGSGGAGGAAATAVLATAGSGAAATAAITQGVASVAVGAGGSGYTSTPMVSFLGGGGSGAAATATISAAAAQVIAINVTSAGSGYTSAPTVVFSGGGGSGASATAAVSGVVSSINVTSAGSGYATAPAVVLSGGGGSGASGAVTLQAQGVASVNVVSAGSNFGGGIGAPVPTVTFEGGGGSGATAQIVLQPAAIASVVVTNPGSGYTTTPTVTVTGADPTTAATFSVVVNAGRVQSVTVLTGGAGYVSPVNIALSAPPTGGTQATASVRLTPQPVNNVVVTNPGQFYTTAPTAIVSAGENNAASATVSLMPYGVSGSAFDTYLSRVWIVAPATAPFETIPAATQWNFSAAGSVADFATADGGGSANSTDAFLQTEYTGVRQSSGYLYFFGDGSANVVTNVGTAGTPATTTYSYQNVDSQAGLSWRDSLQDFGRSLVAASELGIFGLYGGAMTKVSAKIDQMLSATPEGPAFYPQNGGVTPSSAVATIFNAKHYLNLVTLADPATGVPRNVMLAWNEKDWFIASQSVSFTFIAEQKVGSTYAAWGTDGSKIYPMFQTPSATLPKRMWTKAYGADSFFVQKTAQFLWLQAQDKSAGGAGIAGTVTTEVSTIGELLDGTQPALISGEYTTALQQPGFMTPAGTWPIWGTSLQGIAFTTMGLKITTTSPDFLLGNLAIGYLNAAAYA